MTQPVYDLATAPLTETDPEAYVCATVRDFVVLGGLVQVGATLYDVQWSAIGDPTDWPTPDTDDARAKQSGRQSMVEKFGYVTGIAGNDFYGYVFQERAITKMTYVGGDVVFSFDTFEESRGCVSWGRMTTVDDIVFFESQFGYHMLMNDQVSDIGYGIVDDTY